MLILVVDDEPDVEVLFRQQFRRDEFAQSAPMALKRITDAAGASLILILSDINMPGMSGLELLPKAKALRLDVPKKYQQRRHAREDCKRATRATATLVRWTSSPISGAECDSRLLQ